MEKLWKYIAALFKESMMSGCRVVHTTESCEECNDEDCPKAKR